MSAVPVCSSASPVVLEEVDTMVVLITDMKVADERLHDLA